MAQKFIQHLFTFNNFLITKEQKNMKKECLNNFN